MIRSMQLSDIAAVNASFVQQGWPLRTQVLHQYLHDQTTRQRRVFIAEEAGTIAGYVTLLPAALTGPFADKLPEISDFNVFTKFQRHGIGSTLLDAAEQAAAQLAAAVSLGVGLHAGYGPAQRLYVKRGYVSDGSGVWYQDKPLPMNALSRNDDDLVLYMSKALTPETN
jgi:GNAT superfamily N-acetyltransferase